MLKEIRLDAFKAEIASLAKQVELCATKDETDKRLVEMMSSISTATNTLGSLASDFTKNKTRVEMKLEDLADKGRGRTESIMNLQKQIEEFSSTVLKHKQSAAAAGKGGLQKQKTRGERSDTEEITTTELQELIESECKDIRGDIKEILEELRTVKTKSASKAETTTNVTSSQRNVLEVSGSTNLRQLEEKCLKQISHLDTTQFELKQKIETMELLVSVTVICYEYSYASRSV